MAEDVLHQTKFCGIGGWEEGGKRERERERERERACSEKGAKFHIIKRPRTSFTKNEILSINKL